MKIAFIGQKGMPTKSGGVDRHVENLAIFLVQKKQEVIVYNRNHYLPEKINEWKGVKLVHLPFIDQKNLAAISHGFLATFDAIFKKVDVIHYHGIGPSLLTWIPRLLAPKIKVVSTLHSFDYGNDKWSSFAKFMLRLGEKTMCTFAHDVIVLTDLMHDYLWQRYNVESIVIPNGAYIEKDFSMNKLHAFGLRPQEYIISVSRLIRLKGIQYLIEAFKKIDNKNIKLAIIGDGEYQTELEELAFNDPRIVFTGNQGGETLNQLYTQAKMFVQSSEMEGLSISLLEAMAHGLPIIVSDISANRQATQDTALYFKSKNVADLKNKLEFALNNPAEMEKLGNASQKRAENVYDWDNVSADTLKVYKK
ncbi:MAG TPA: glycosyltransferase family 4 protein [Patescibacteria group bacterium]|nr:glycosyltransferase family 4 protein [Patescibacteria group bacterium]